MGPKEPRPGAVFEALADPTRREVVRRLAQDGPATATELAGDLPVTRQAVAKHLTVLDRVGLVHGTTSGREKKYDVDAAQLARAVAQLAHVGDTWDRRLQRIKKIAEAVTEKRR